MSSIFNECPINCAILGGKQKAKPSVLNAATILLNSGNRHLRAQNLENLFKCGFEEIVCAESDKNYNIEDFVQNFPQVRFIIPQKKTCDGTLINIAMSEISAPYALVIRDTIHITPQILTARLSENLANQNIFCVAPRLFSRDKNAVPSQFVPGVQKSILKIESSFQVSDGIATLYPFNYLGFYDTQKFRHLGGYDCEIKTSYWQNLDMAFRAWLWGEKIKISTGFALFFDSEIPLEDSTPEISQLRFFLKNMAPVLKDGRAKIPLSKFLSFKMRSSCGIFESVHQFACARAWVKENERRFLMDAFNLISGWGKIN